ncbi:COG4315 family predicted lipoprotein [Phytohabitans sp. LJ34]|uniref:COG4315 family predicted lipoprotein n=1 Tax=Phytohabitans sp. LJ34 TaxID=3452217 RepID=UPI003F896B4C
MTSLARRLTTAAVIAAALALGACSSPDTSTSQPTPTDAADIDLPPPGVASTAKATVQPQQITLALAQTKLGLTLTTGGLTVYRLEADGHDPARSICENDCPVNWPPLLTDGSAIQLPPEIDPKLVGTVQRNDGTTQVTLAGWPLYRFVGDKKPGDVTGENIGGNWSAVGKDGKPLVKK